MAMDFELEWVHPSLVICRVSGVVTVEGCEALIRATMSKLQFRPGIGMITDLTNADVSGLAASDIEQIADLRAQFAHAHRASVESSILILLTQRCLPRSP
jgi:hypothetical protein